VRAVRDSVIQAVVGTLGIIFGFLSAVALALAALIPAILGVLAIVLSPLRALLERVRGENRG
jgi:hypothetical protein